MPTRAELDAMYGGGEVSQPSAPKLTRAELDAMYSEPAQQEPATSATATSALKPVQPTRSEHPARKYSTALEATRSGLRGLTMGASDVLGAGVAAGAAAMSPNVEFGDAYRDIKTELSADRDVFREQEPALALGTELGGAIIPAIATFGASAPATGTALVPAGIRAAGTTAKTIAPSVLKGAALGAGQGGVYGASQADVGNELTGGATGAAIGGALGGALPLAGKAVKGMIAPKAAANADLAKLKAMGVEPSIGQALGGLANKIEQKAQSIPLVGEQIASRRMAAREQFNTGVLNEVLKPIGAKVSKSGTDGVKEAGDIASKAYKDALNEIDSVMFDDAFDTNLTELRSMASNLSPEYAKRFEKVLSDEVLNRTSPAGGMLPDVYKKTDSVIGNLSSRYSKSANASEAEFGDSLKQLQALLKDQMMRSNPNTAEKLKAADTAWAMLTRVEDAAGRAANSDGVFTPAQLNAAIKSGDKSTRRRSVARGEALMQKTAQAGQGVLADTVPNSGTVDRAALLLSGALGALNPVATGAVLGAGYGAYTRPAQNALVRLATERSPQMLARGGRLNELMAGKTGDQLRRAAIISANNGGAE